jgi:hypothetical protein
VEAVEGRLPGVTDAGTGASAEKRTAEAAPSIPTDKLNVLLFEPTNYAILTVTDESACQTVTELDVLPSTARAEKSMLQNATPVKTRTGHQTRQDLSQ